MMTRKLYRQGDVLLERLPDTLPTPKPARLARDAQGRVVLALGEATGHAHAFRDEHVAQYEMPDGARYLEITTEPAVLFHEEHAPIEVPPGLYRVRRQREYHPDELRTVAD